MLCYLQTQADSEAAVDSTGVAGSPLPLRAFCQQQVGRETSTVSFQSSTETYCLSSSSQTPGICPKEEWLSKKKKEAGVKGIPPGISRTTYYNHSFT